MDPTRFDALARAFAPRRTRRAVVRLAAGAVLALDGTARPDAVAAHRKRKCAHGETKCKKTCCQRGDLCAQGTCVTGQGTCKTGVDACTSVGVSVLCHGNGEMCECHRRLEGGTRCAKLIVPGSDCDQCTTDADCLAKGFPPGSSCVTDCGVCDTTNDLGNCVAPCGS